MSKPIEFRVNVNVPFDIDARDVVSGLNDNDESILQFICQVIACTHSLELREQLLTRLGVFLCTPESEELTYDPNVWDDDEFLPRTSIDAEMSESGSV